MEMQKPVISAALVKRYLLFLLGLLIAAMGVAVSAKAGLGTSPVASLPYSVSLISDRLTFGGWLNLLSVLQILVQILVMKGKCNPFEIAVQLVLAFVYGYLTNFSVWLIRGVTVSNYAQQALFCVLGCVILALGIWVQLKGGVAMMPGEAMNRAISAALHVKFETVKITADLLYIAASAVICLVFLGRLAGVREGSIFAAAAVGLLIKLYQRLFEQIKRRRKRPA